MDARKQEYGLKEFGLRYVEPDQCVMPFDRDTSYQVVNAVSEVDGKIRPYLRSLQKFYVYHEDGRRERVCTTSRKNGEVIDRVIGPFVNAYRDERGLIRRGRIEKTEEERFLPVIYNCRYHDNFSPTAFILPDLYSTAKTKRLAYTIEAYAPPAVIGFDAKGKVELNQFAKILKWRNVFVFAAKKDARFVKAVEEAIKGVDTRSVRIFTFERDLNGNPFPNQGCVGDVVDDLTIAADSPYGLKCDFKRYLSQQKMVTLFDRAWES